MSQIRVLVILIIMSIQSTKSLAWSAFRKSHFTTRRFAMSSDFAQEVVSSPKSKTAKFVKNLLNKRKKRTEAQQTVVEGPRMVFDLLENPSTEGLVRQILISVDDYQELFQDRFESLASISQLSLIFVTPELLNTLSDTVTPQGKYFRWPMVPGYLRIAKVGKCGSNTE